MHTLVEMFSDTNTMYTSLCFSGDIDNTGTHPSTL